MRSLPIVLSTLATLSIARAQPFYPTAAFRVTANDAYNIIVDPGEPVRLDLRIEWQPPGLSLASFDGILKVSNDAGTSTNFAWHLGASPLIYSGVSVGGSRYNVEAGQGPPLFGSFNPLFTNQPVHVLTYDVTFDTPGVYTARWQPSVTSPGAMIYQSLSSAQATYYMAFNPTATITVTPAPATLALLGVAALAGRRRR